MGMTGMKRMWGIAGAIALLMVLAGCAATHQARSVETSGFLRDYSKLQQGQDNQALLTYTNPKADFRKYDKILLDPIKVYPGVGDSAFQEMSPEDMKTLLNYFDATLRRSLGTQYKFVKSPGPGVMRFRIALTESDGSKVALDVVSSVVPIGMAVSALKSVAFGEGSAVGSASAELEVLDAQTGERLAAAVDRRVGNKYTGQFDKFSKWRATRAAFDYWAERMRERLTELRTGRPLPSR